MNNFIFENSTKAIFGKGCVKEYLACLAGHYGPNVLLAYGGGSIKRNGVYDEVYEILRAAGKNIYEFSGIMPNPTYAKVQEGAKLARENHIDLFWLWAAAALWTAARRYLWPRPIRGICGRISGPGPAWWILSPSPWGSSSPCPAPEAR